MLPTFVIGLREGLEASLIVGIIAAFLRQLDRKDLLRWVFAGVVAALVLCTAAGVTLKIVSQNLPQRQQEGLETVIGLLAVAMVTYMIVWMRRHSREMRGQLHAAAADAVAAGSGFALVLMAFLAVLREGIETVVFLLAAFDENGNSTASGAGAGLGIALAVVLGYGIYRGGVKINLSKFFRATGVVLAFVAAGLVVNALHTAHEAGWLNIGQQQTVDLSALVRSGSVQASLLTGMLGIQAHPVRIEVIGWLIYLIPVALYVGWPPGRAVPKRLFARGLAVGGVVLGVAAVVLVVAAPGRPGGQGRIAQVVASSGDQVTVRTAVQSPAGGTVAGTWDLVARRTGSQTLAGLATDAYTATTAGGAAAGRPATLSRAELIRIGGGRLPLGVPASLTEAPVTYTDRDVLTLWLEPRTQRVIAESWQQTVTVTAALPIGATALGTVAHAGTSTPSATVTQSASAARTDLATLDQRDLLRAAAGSLALLAGVLLVLAAGFVVASVRSKRGSSKSTAAPRRTLVAS